MSKQEIIENIKLDKLVHGGQCLGQTPEGKLVFVWNGLPGEVVDAVTIKKKSKYLEAIVTKVHKSSPNRIEPIEPDSYISTSPWQIMTFKSENIAKQNILSEAFEREGVKKVTWKPFTADLTKEGLNYRNKQEFGFWGDEQGIHTAHFVRGSHSKQIVSSSTLANEKINAIIPEFVKSINDFAKKQADFIAGDLKTATFRCSGSGEVVMALFVKKKYEFSTFDAPVGLKGFVVYYSNPKSPASVPTKKLYTSGDITLTDIVGGKNIKYDVLSFFQVNLPVFETALKKITSVVKAHKKLSQKAKVIDMYSGVGTIGICVGADTLVESDSSNIPMAKVNVEGTETEVVHATSEYAVEHIAPNSVLIVDPPRAGLHSLVIDRILEAKPSKIVYLSCNPSTQARDIRYLSSIYKITFAQGYNFFPRTPHIESLIILELK